MKHENFKSYIIHFFGSLSNSPKMTNIVFTRNINIEIASLKKNTLYVSDTTNISRLTIYTYYKTIYSLIENENSEVFIEKYLTQKHYWNIFDFALMYIEKLFSRFNK
jgi:hypothetical protein